MPGHHLNHSYSILRTSISIIATPGKQRRYLSQKWSSDGNQYLNLKRLTSLDFLVPGSCLLSRYINVKISIMCSKFALSQEMLPMGRLPAFGQPRPPPQRRVLRTIDFKWCDKQNIVRQHKEIASGNFIWSSETSSSYKISWILQTILIILFTL